MKTLFIAGGSASGKTWLADRVAGHVGACTRISQDSFYHDRPSGSAEDRHKFDFDRPEAIHWDEMSEALKRIKTGAPTRIPIYDMTVSLRDGYETLTPVGDTLLVDGTLVLHAAPVCDLADVSVFVRAPQSLRQVRREKRDVEERGRDLMKTRHQLMTQVFPAHDEFVAPCAAKADLVLDAEDVLADSDTALERILALLEKSG